VCPRLTRDQIRDYYVHYGSLQDTQGYYEDGPLSRLIEGGAFQRARSVAEFGCGTGRLANRILTLSPHSSYIGLDLSQTMLEVTADRLARFDARAILIRTSGAPSLPLGEASVDRVVAAYVLDILSAPEIELWLADAARVLCRGGLLCVANLTWGTTLRSRVVSLGWWLMALHFPRRVGGCRPIDLISEIAGPTWNLLQSEKEVQGGIASQILIAEKIG